MNPIQFGMPLARVEKAVANHEKVRVQRADGSNEVCELYGPFVEQEMPAELTAKLVKKNHPELDPKKPAQAYLVGFKHIEAQEKKFREGVSHGLVFEQEGEIPQLSVLA